MKVAFVDDDEKFVSVQKAHLVRAEQEIGVNYEVFTFSDGLDLLGEISLPVSRHRRREFKEDFMKYLGGDL